MDFTRQLGIFNPKKYGSQSVAVIGAGSVGSFVTLTLAKMGMYKIRVYDADIVEQHNMPNQFYHLEHIGHFKVRALAHIVNMFTGAKIVPESKRYTRYAASDIIISSVDSIEARRKIWALIKPHMFKKTTLYIDTRMGGEYMRVFTITKPEDIEAYEKTLEREGEHLPCTAKTVVYNVVTVAGMVGYIVKAFLTKAGRFPTQVVFDIPNLDLQVFPYKAKGV